MTTSSSKLSTATAKITTLQTKPKVFLQVTQRAVAQVLRIDMSCGLLLKRKGMAAGGEFQLPCLDLFLLGECIRFHYSLHYRGKFSSRFINILDIALVA